jgi:hypothetical protein
MPVFHFMGLRARLRTEGGRFLILPVFHLEGRVQERALTARNALVIIQETKEN